ncbi:unnamed protein product [Vitrella brassicaformis CCMP3155]|uniref:Uncharacterized protein n=1 Tax=Vitrella brassicaformis (strain CCMP3155) TaxID=1169540 RepID=A0A0G4EP05_VITBC|nr:unnamed protein product [Vitrella brassicaformis CCMP3155]|eukprot:CEL99358.1 unnamed protein product [Vitrella brassicaformis CCMP3155]
MMIWLLRWWTSRFSYRRVADHRQLLSTSTEEDDSTAQLSVVIGGAGADQGLPADVFARVVIPLLPVDDAVRLRGVGKAYGAQLIDEAFLLGRINSCLAQQQLTGLINVERDRGADTSAPPLPAPLLRLGYLARCAYVIERAAEWRYMARFIRVASACGAAGQLPLVLSGESVAAHIPHKATFHRLPATMAVYQIFGGLLGSGAQLTEGRRGKTSVAVISLHPLVTAAVYLFFLLWFAWVLVVSTLGTYQDVRNGPLSDRPVLCWIAALAASLWISATVLAGALMVGWQLPSLLHQRKRKVQWYRFGERRFRLIDGDELWRLHPFMRRTCRHTDPPVSCSTPPLRVYRSFSAFALDTLLERLAYPWAPGLMSVILDVTVGRRGGYRVLLRDAFSGESDPFVVDSRVDSPTAFLPLYVPMRVVVLLLGGGSVVASVSLDEGRIVVRTTEAAVSHGVPIDGRFPVTVAAVRQLLRRFGLENETVGPLP